MKIVLDTNAFYAYMGINNDKQVMRDDFINLLSNSENKISISSIIVSNPKLKKFVL